MTRPAGPTPSLLGPPREPEPADLVGNQCGPSLLESRNWNPSSTVDHQYNGQYSIIAQIGNPNLPLRYPTKLGGPQTLFCNFEIRLLTVVFPAHGSLTRKPRVILRDPSWPFIYYLVLNPTVETQLHQKHWTKSRNH